MRKVCQVSRWGTTRLLQLTKDMTEEDRQEILTYIGWLETSENRLAETIQQFYNSISMEVNR